MLSLGGNLHVCPHSEQLAMGDNVEEESQDHQWGSPDEEAYGFLCNTIAQGR